MAVICPGCETEVMLLVGEEEDEKDLLPNSWFECPVCFRKVVLKWAIRTESGEDLSDWREVMAIE